MSELMIGKDKKTEWLTKYGTENALDLLGLQVEELSNKAIQSNLLSKELTDMNQVTDVTDPLAGLTEKSTQAVAKTADGFDDLSALKEDKEVNIVVSENVAETPATEVVVIDEPVKTELSNENKELVDVIVESLVNPVLDKLVSMEKGMSDRDAVIAEQGVELKQLRVALGAIQKELKIQELQIQEDKIPQASTVALVKDYINQRISGSSAIEQTSILGKAVESNDPLLARKPVENKVKTAADNGTFSGFLQGV